MKAIAKRVAKLEQAQHANQPDGNAMARIWARLEILARNLRAGGMIEPEPITPEHIAFLRSMVLQEVARYASN